MTGKYRSFSRILTLLLLMSFFTPLALQACQFAEFCMMEMSSKMSEEHHEGCESAVEVNAHSAHSHHDCEGESVCACFVDQHPLNNEILVPVSTAAIIFQENGFNQPLISSDEPLRFDQQTRTGLFDPPLYIQYDTLLS